MEDWGKKMLERWKNWWREEESSRKKRERLSGGGRKAGKRQWDGIIVTVFAGIIHSHRTLWNPYHLIFWNVYTSVFGVQESRRFFSNSEATWIYGKLTTAGQTTSIYCWATNENRREFTGQLWARKCVICSSVHCFSHHFAACAQTPAHMNTWTQTCSRSNDLRLLAQFVPFLGYFCSRQICFPVITTPFHLCVVNHRRTTLCALTQT